MNHLVCKSPFDLIEKMLEFSDSSFNKSNNFPPHNIYVIGKSNESENSKLVYEFALAGFNKDEINIETHNGTMKISGKHVSENKENVRMIKKGIADRSFEIRYLLPEECNQAPVANFNNGILTVSFDIVQSPVKKISIN